MNLLITFIRSPYVCERQGNRSGAGLTLLDPVVIALISLEVIPGRKWRPFWIIGIMLAASVKNRVELTRRWWAAGQ